MIPRQKTDREWHDPDEVRAPLVTAYIRYFDIRFFFFGVAFYFLLRFITHTPITVGGLIIMLVASAVLAPAFGYAYEQIQVK